MNPHGSTVQPGISQARAVDAERVESALSLIAPRWTTWVAQTLAHQHRPMRFGDISAQLPFFSKPVLSRRLAQMISDGLVTRGEALHASYHLTGLGRSLSPVHQALVDWSHNHFHFVPGAMAGAERVEDALRRLHLRHTTAVVNALGSGPMRFVHIGEAVGLDSAYTRQRLIRLQADGLVTRTGPRYGDPYALTAAGRALGPVYAAAERWSNLTSTISPAAPHVARARSRAQPGPDGIRTAAALRRSPGVPGALFSHAPTPQPRVPATVTAQSAPARGR